jgi:tRNA A37 threonylcarbamoyladenosine synthetase subunit TsaC/SUA5/YrdC
MTAAAEAIEEKLFPGRLTLIIPATVSSILSWKNDTEFPM